MDKLGKIEKVDLRVIWPHEAKDFTPWLAEHIDVLGESLGMELEFVESEHKIGDFSLDILAQEVGTGFSVVIENQMHQTDHDHLGKLITYAAGKNASTVVWISKEIRDEHRQAFEWLNARTDIGTTFFGVIVEVLKIGDSQPAPRFDLVVTPNNWQKLQKQTKPNKEFSELQEKYRDFYQSLIDALREKNFTGAKKAVPQSWYDFSSGVPGFRYGVAISKQKKQARVALYIDHQNAEVNSKFLKAFQKQSEEIKTALGFDVEYKLLEANKVCHIVVTRNGAIFSSVEKEEEVRSWIINKLLKFREVFTPRLRNLPEIEGDIED